MAERREEEEKRREELRLDQTRLLRNEGTTRLQLTTAMGSSWIPLIDPLWSKIFDRNVWNKFFVMKKEAEPFFFRGWWKLVKTLNTAHQAQPHAQSVYALLLEALLCNVDFIATDHHLIICGTRCLRRCEESPRTYKPRGMLEKLLSNHLSAPSL